MADPPAQAQAQAVQAGMSDFCSAVKFAAA